MDLEKEEEGNGEKEDKFIEYAYANYSLNTTAQNIRTMQQNDKQ